MKKMFLGVVLGAVAGAVGYKLYKEREDEIKDFLDEYITDDDFDVDSVDVEDLEDLRDCIDEMIDTKLNVENSFTEDKFTSTDDFVNDENKDDEEYIFINNDDHEIIDLTKESSNQESKFSDNNLK
ncbi:hypothetical protein UF10_04060 [Peptostreptococcus russellii]|uniref:Uncharacterized protein n=1 Tax=Peptostreptococcus russellii TaxID=215200 RepID=A0A2P7Q1F9_9FIRM|nr:hypothetical protein [Peptostreptococcus russellii]PSJ31799.1 hypothetical protein UF10_04060 [Peptostreptococcus russellii]